MIRAMTIEGFVVTEIEMRDVLAKRLMSMMGMSTAQASSISDEIVEAFFATWKGGK
jgi:hypothetical protein